MTRSSINISIGTDIPPNFDALYDWLIGADLFADLIPIGRTICPDCETKYDEAECWGCPIAWRQKDGATEYWRKPKHSIPGA